MLQLLPAVIVPPKAELTNRGMKYFQHSAIIMQLPAPANKKLFKNGLFGNQLKYFIAATLATVYPVFLSGLRSTVVQMASLTL